MSTSSGGPEATLRRSLSFYDGVGVSVGIMIGSGIFASPGVALSRCGSAGSALLAWTSAGVLVLCASFCYAELATSIPDAGGDFAYLQRAYGDAASFSFAWFNFWIGKTGSQAIITTVCSHYLVSGLFGSSFSSSHQGEMVAKAIAIVLVVFLCVLNCAGVKESAAIVNTLTMLKLVLVLSLFAAASIFVVLIDSSMVAKNLSIYNSFSGASAPGFFTGMIACLWAYDGWADLNFMAEELIDAEKVLPRVIICSIMAVAISYVTANVAYFATLELSDITESHSVAMDFGQKISGRWFSLLMSFGVALSAAGSANGSIMTGGRAFYAVSRSGRAPSAMALLNSQGSPWVALIAQAMWTIVLLCIPGSNFSALLDYFGPASWMFYALTGVGVVILRFKEPNLKRPFKVPLYPLPPIVLCLLSLCIVIESLLMSPFFTFLAFSFIGSAIPVYYLTFREFFLKKRILNFAKGTIPSLFEFNFLLSAVSVNRRSFPHEPLSQDDENTVSPMALDVSVASEMELEGSDY